MEVVATATDWQGRPVRITAERWGKVTAGHPEMASYLDAVVATEIGLISGL